jgi:L,D-transpeptidase ErfK/SrfK
MPFRKLGIISLSLMASLLISPLTHAKMYGAQLCKEPGFVCQKVKRGQSWKSLFPDEYERDIVMRVNRLNISLYPGIVLAVPENLEVGDVLDYAPFPRQIETTEKVVMVDPAERAWGAFDEGGNLIKWGPLSAGADYCPDIGKGCRTKAGSFRVYSLGSSNCVSRKFPVGRGGAPMPYCMFFNGGIALHGSPGGLVGYNASHGCVRLNVHDAEWLRYDFIEGPNVDNNYRGTRIIVKPYN